MKFKLASTVFVIGSLLTPVMDHAFGQDMDRSHPEAYAKDFDSNDKN
ncbi:hypothetical protein QU481_23310 [Crenobacter sp. SG2303]|uniref:Uncharacterized protein n=1 Tax=Crenobacter oryzisoli TaxID=3056844 RepID=A0ABT7XVH0_9NEIS|nr:hypothetical protein [Crenobacter sp. SG2303]MDN0077738.1 hypothetical protein [Crenobacter sp. SG2303]